ncbi:MAG: leucine-rich repeat protein [Candidatus Gracilibacteria bacterium]|nr:leucine-rich repeat protein [Candidatus Gracilibacteria bacterium]
MNKRSLISGFTLVELIVVITILSILATVAFISFQGYGLSARDSVRLSDINNIEKVINLYRLQGSSYPEPNYPTSITYSGSTAWQQGVFGKNSFTHSTSMGNIPTDPLTELPYAYSVTNTKQEYQIAAIMEGTISNTLIPKSHAGDQIGKIYVKGDYNGQFLKVDALGNTYLLGVPSILASDIVSADLMQIITNQRFVYNGYNNLPASYSGSQYNSNGGFNFTPNQLILFEGDINDVTSSNSTQISILGNLQNNYSGSIISNNNSISNMLTIDITNNNQASNYIATQLNNSLSTDIVINENVTVIDPCANRTDESHFTFNNATQTITAYDPVGGGLDVLIPCTINDLQVLHIGPDAFEGHMIMGHVTPFISSVNLPEGLQTIGANAFHANELSHINIPNSVTEIGDGAFWWNNISELVLPSTITSIGHGAFRNNNISEIIIPNSLTSIASSLFYNNNISSLIIPNTVTSIGQTAFRNNNISTLTLPNSITTIPYQAFDGNNITDLIIPSSVTSIGQRAFSGNHLENITIPNSVTEILMNAFVGQTGTTTGTVYGPAGYVEGLFSDLYYFDQDQFDSYVVQ